MPMKAFKYFILILLILLPQTALSQNPSHKTITEQILKEGWVKKRETSEFTIFFRDVKGPGTGEILMIGIIDASPAKMFQIVTNYKHFMDYMPFVEYAKVLHEEKVSTKKHVSYVFFYISAPIVSSRFYTIRLTDEINFDGEEGVYRSKWDLDVGKYRKTPDDPDIKPYLQTGWQMPVETPINEGYWLLKPVDEGKKTYITYYLWTNPGGAINPELANEANVIALPKLWNTLKKQADLYSK
ncbi:MAG: hypothetical protein HQK78_13945 [Desulfobacterales bacterium]|nr:hypothetical protein [Desulfobacterales bacterium]